MAVDTVKVLKIMISSTRADLMAYRNKAADILEKLRRACQSKVQIITVSMEEEVQTGGREFAVAISKKWIKASDWVVLIVGFNYGTISTEEGANGLSVTEWEYRHAVETGGKKIFVFIAGEPGTSNAYTGKVDAENLALSMFSQSEEQSRKIKAFRAFVGGPHADYFSDINHFSSRLERTLEKAIEDLWPPMPPALATLILSLQDSALRPCFDSIKLLHCCKEIHDALHELRQEVVLPVKGERVPAWEKAGELTRENERKLTNYRVKAGALLARIDGLRGALNSETSGRLCLFIEGLGSRLDKLNPWDEEAEGYVTLEFFEERLDDFKTNVEDAFTEANAQMQREKGAFEKLRTPMLKSLNEASEDYRLSADEKKTLDDEIKKIEWNQDRLVATLNVHAGWQKIHDENVMLQSVIGTKQFPAKCARFCEINGREIDLLISRFFPFDDDDLDETGKLRNRIEAMKSAFSQLEGQYDEENFAGFCKMFDDSFYLVDKCTLAVVQRASTRVEDLEVDLKKLAASGSAKAK